MEQMPNQPKDYKAWAKERIASGEASETFMRQTLLLDALEPYIGNAPSTLQGVDYFKESALAAVPPMDEAEKDALFARAEELFAKLGSK